MGPGIMITTMESVTIKNAENKLEACSGKRKIHDRSKAVVANVSLGAMGGRRRLALLDKFHVGQRVQLADRKHPTSRYPQGQRVKGDYGILSKKLAKKHKYLPQKWIPAGAKGTVKKVASATRGYSTAEDSALAVWVVFDDIKTFTPGKMITTMAPVRIENAPNKLEACTTPTPTYALPSKAVVANVSLGGRRRLAPLDVGQRVQLATRKHPTSRYPEGQKVRGYYGILSKKLAKKEKYLPQKWIPAGAKGTVLKVKKATIGYSAAEDKALAVWVVFDDIKTFGPGKKITTMAPVRIENASNKLEACTTPTPTYALPSKAEVKNVSLGGK